MVSKSGEGVVWQRLGHLNLCCSPRLGPTALQFVALLIIYFQIFQKFDYVEIKSKVI